jgi:glycosyltransferase involved in cell wall biosynthesis
MPTAAKQQISKSDPELLSVIVPAYNCPTIDRDLALIRQHLISTRQPYEIICVIDGLKSDRDTTRVKARKAKKPDTKIYFYSRNRGKGYAIRYGMARARGGIVAFIDAGSDLKALGLSMALEHMRWYQADIIIGSKRHPASKVTYPLRRKILSFIVQRITRLFFGLNVTDTQTGLKVFRRQVLEKVLPRLLVKRWAFDLEILTVARRLGFTKIYESPIELQYNFASNIDAGAVRNFAIDYLAILYRTYILRYYDDDHNDLWQGDPKLKSRYH